MTAGRIYDMTSTQNTGTREKFMSIKITFMVTSQ